MDSPQPDDLTRAVSDLERRLAATRGRLAAQDERLARLRDDLRRLNDGYAALRPSASPPAPPARATWTPALSFVLVTVIAAYARVHQRRAPAPAQRLVDAVAAPATMNPPAGDNDVAQGLRLVYAYRPTKARVTVGEILEPLLGRELKPGSFEIFPAPSEGFRVVFKPFTDDVGLANDYEFLVEPGRSLVRPTPRTLRLLKIDAAGRLASRSDFEGLRQVLDLDGQGEVLVGQSVGGMSR